MSLDRYKPPMSLDDSNRLLSGTGANTRPLKEAAKAWLFKLAVSLAGLAVAALLFLIGGPVVGFGSLILIVFLAFASP